MQSAGSEDPEASAGPETSFIPTEFDNEKSEPFANSRVLLFAIIILVLILFAAIGTLARRIRR